MGSTRNAVLKHLLNHQRSTINELAKAVKINPISVRHHITRLEKEGLVASAQERHGVGRPRRVYFLSEAGMEHFPGRTIRFTFRCDAPTLRRVLEMDASLPGDGTVRFLTRTLAEESRPAVPLLDPAAARSDDKVLVCGWCRKVAVGSTWEEVEKAVAELRLFEQVPMPRTTHGICEACYERVRKTMD